MTNLTIDKFQDALENQLKITDAEILRVSTPLLAAKNGHQIFYVECLGRNDIEDAKDAIADAGDPNAAARAYSTTPKPFYVMLDYDGTTKTWDGKVMDQMMIRALAKTKLEIVIE